MLSDPHADAPEWRYIAASAAFLLSILVVTGAARRPASCRLEAEVKF
jgi:hypothetical protein